MSCIGSLPFFDCSLKPDESGIKNAIDKVAIEVPSKRKELKLLYKKARIESVSFVGRGHFDIEGKFYSEKIKDGFKWCIKYYYPEVIDEVEAKLKDKYKPVIFSMCLNPELELVK